MFYKIYLNIFYKLRFFCSLNKMTNILKKDTTCVVITSLR